MSNINADSPREDILAALREEGFDQPDGEATAKELLELLTTVTGTDYSKLATPPKATKAKAKAKVAQKVKLTIPSNEGPNGKGDVYVGVNGRNFLLQRDVEVEVPRGVYEVLNNAKTTVGRQENDGSVEYHQVHTYPFSVVL